IDQQNFTVLQDTELTAQHQLASAWHDLEKELSTATTATNTPTTSPPTNTTTATNTTAVKIKATIEGAVEEALETFKALKGD
ncbi:hypothetical protein HK102_012499, partial [Quaeritorhiza haematococci]